MGVGGCFLFTQSEREGFLKKKKDYLATFNFPNEFRDISAETVTKVLGQELLGCELLQAGDAWDHLDSGACGLLPAWLSLCPPP